MFAPILLVAGLLASGANAAISIANPVTGQTLFKNTSVAFNWTAGPDDPKIFQVLLSNPNTQLLPTNPHQLAQQVSTQDGFVRISLGQIQPGGDFTLSFANTTNASQVFAQVEELKIEDGIPATSSLPSGQSTATTPSSTVDIPNAPKTTAAASSANPFASASAKPGSGAGSTKPAVGTAVVLAAAAAALAL